MPDTSAETFKKIDEALKGGRISEAAKLAADAASAAPASTAPASSSSAAPAAPRDPAVILDDLINSIVAYLGSPPVLVQFLEELAAMKKPTADESAKPVA